jgi:membrane associated rhomboid family serine protease
MFVHGGFAHIIGNMLVFFFIGMAFEQRIGWKNFITIYILTGICGALTHSLINIGTDNAGIILIGASGAIFGVMGAFAYSYPRDEVVMPIPLGIIMVIRRVKVIYAVLIFAALETIIVLLDVQDTTAHFAHLGGLVSGVIFAAFLIRNKRTNQTSSYTQPIHYETSTSQNQQKFDITNLKKYATTSDLKKELKMIENENVPQVRDVWIEHFLEKAKCPKCKKVLKSFNGKIWCENCGYKSNY